MNVKNRVSFAVVKFLNAFNFATHCHLLFINCVLKNWEKVILDLFIRTNFYCDGYSRQTFLASFKICFKINCSINAKIFRLFRSNETFAAVHLDYRKIILYLYIRDELSIFTCIFCIKNKLYSCLNFWCKQIWTFIKSIPDHRFGKNLPAKLITNKTSII